jgi:hypothetical protein
MTEEEKQSTSGADVLTWLGIDLNSFASGLQKRMPDISSAVSMTLVKSLIPLHPLLRPAFKQWWETGSIPDLGEFSGYTVNDLMTRFRPSGLFAMLDTLIKDPQTAIEQLNSRRDTIIPATGANRPFHPGA